MVESNKAKFNVLIPIANLIIMVAYVFFLRYLDTKEKGVHYSELMLFPLVVVVHALLCLFMAALFQRREFQFSAGMLVVVGFLICYIGLKINT
jgi:hypothetical protein